MGGLSRYCRRVPVQDRGGSADICAGGHSDDVLHEWGEVSAKVTVLSRITVLVVALVLAGTACGAPSRDPGVPESPPSVTSTTEKPSEVMVAGVVVSGVETGCLVLDTDAEDYLLLGGDHDVLQPGRSVEVRGAPKPDTVTTCQQGVPFEVHEVVPA